MQDQQDHEDKTRKRPRNIYLFGEPVIKSSCHKNALMSGMVGGIFGGLFGFLFTSNAKKSTRIAAGTFFVISMVYTCYCTYEEIYMNNCMKEIKEARRARLKLSSTNVISDDATNNSKSI